MAGSTKSLSRNLTANITSVEQSLHNTPAFQNGVTKSLQRRCFVVGKVGELWLKCRQLGSKSVEGASEERTACRVSPARQQSCLPPRTCHLNRLLKPRLITPPRPASSLEPKPPSSDPSSLSCGTFRPREWRPFLLSSTV